MHIDIERIVTRFSLTDAPMDWSSAKSRRMNVTVLDSATKLVRKEYLAKEYEKSNTLIHESLIHLLLSIEVITDKMSLVESSRRQNDTYSRLLGSQF